jgi:hypothetical protein
MVTSSATRGRSSPSRDRVVVPSVRVPRSTRLMTVSAVRLLVPLAVANWVWTVLRRPRARSAKP